MTKSQIIEAKHFIKTSPQLLTKSQIIEAKHFIKTSPQLLTKSQNIILFRMIFVSLFKNKVRTDLLLEATPGFEPGIRVLQTRALPLGYIAILYKKMERETGLKPATFALATRRSINWAIPANQSKIIIANILKKVKSKSTFSRKSG